MRILGIDPGASGALSLLIDGQLVEAWQMPACDGSVVAGPIIDIVREANPDCACIERVGAMPIKSGPGKGRAQGAQSAFVFGLSTGIVTGAIQALGIPLERVVPVVWKKEFGLLKTEKDQSRKAAMELFPAATRFLVSTGENRKLGLFNKVTAGGVADAALIALWYHRKLNRAQAA